jgi:transcriptional regulator with XRE-family HTH domain
MRRMAVGLTQDKLARALGLTFQQVQKYEKGSNRIGAGRLQAISRILDAPLGFFFAEGPGALSAKLQEAHSARTARQAVSPAEGLQLMKSFLKVHDAEARRSLTGVAAALADKAGERDA